MRDENDEDRNPASPPKRRRRAGIRNEAYAAAQRAMNDMVARLNEVGIVSGAKAICTKCNRLKPVSEYYADKKKRNGRHSSCKECVRAAFRDWKARRDADPQYLADPEGYLQRRRERSAARERQRELERLEAAELAEDNMRLSAERREASDRHLAEERALCTPEWWAETMARLEREGRQRAQEWAAADAARRAEKARGVAEGGPDVT